MKKILYSLAAALMFVSCIEGDYGIEAAAPQTNPEETPVTIPDGLSATAVSNIDLGKVAEETISIADVANVTIPQGSTLTNCRLWINGAWVKLNDDFTISKSELQNIVVGVSGLYPKNTAFTDCKLQADVMLNGQGALLESGKFNVNVTPAVPHISTSYYLLGEVTGGWDASNLVALEHGPEADLYLDPNFTATFSAKAGDSFKIVPVENKNSGDLTGAGVLGAAAEGSEALQGSLVSENAYAIKIAADGKYSLAVNMLTGTYAMKALAGQYFLVGNVNGWGAGPEAKVCGLYPTSSTSFVYTTNFGNPDNFFKLWTAADYGTWDKCIGTPVDGATSGTLDGGNAMRCPTAGEDVIYTVTFDFGTNSFSSELFTGKVVNYTSLGIIGGFNGWGAQEPMTEVAPHNWLLKAYTVTETTEFKFRANDDWGIAWGGNGAVNVTTNSFGVAGGDNMTIDPGTYDIYFNSLTYNYNFVKAE